MVILAVGCWCHQAAGSRRERGAGAAAARRGGTGVDPAAPVWGAPFGGMAALYDGSNPPLEALGVSAKFSNGKSATARYYVALELPGSGAT